MTAVQEPVLDLRVRWDELVPGTKTGTMEVEVTPRMVREFLEAMDVRAPVFKEAAGGSGIAPAYLVPKLGLYPLYIDYLHKHGGRGVFAKQEFKYSRPLRIGDRISAEGRLAEKYERRDKRFVVFEGTFRDAAGNVVLTERRTVMVVHPGFKIRD